MKFRYERPNISRKNEAIDFINEFYEYGSKINGVGGFTRYLDDYEGWLRFVEANWNRPVTDTWVPSNTYFLIRKSDDRIVGMIDIRLALTEFLKKYGFIITNPPYGKRLETPEGISLVYKELGQAYRNLDEWSMYLVTAYGEAEKYIGRKADKNRKIYNGMIKTYFYQYYGKKPPRHL